MARITVYVEMSDEDIAAGWSDDLGELEASIKATLHEINGDDGGVYIPKVLGIDVDEDFDA